MDKLCFNVVELLNYIMKNRYFLTEKELDNLDKELIPIVGNILRKKAKKIGDK